MGDQVNFVSNWVGVESVPESYVYPPEKRPGNVAVPVENAIPVVDLTDHDRAFLVHKILDASQEFGFFQVINHGVSKTLIEETMRVFEEFHAMSGPEKKRECSKDPNRSCRVYTSSENFVKEKTHCWRDALIFNCHPLDKYVHFWPQNPSNYREVVGAYCIVMRKLVVEILELISEGLGLGKGYFGDEMSENPLLLVNHYPPCPNPSLTLGLSQHCDPSLITILFQQINGLQVLKDGQWIGVHPVDNAFVVNIGFVLQVVSNGKLKAGEHRAVINAKMSRQSITYLVYPKDDATMEPAKCMINEANPSLYHSLQFKDFQRNYLPMAADTKAVIQYISSDHS
ncbi:hyoscyamine 6-dioxygenase-like [Momordica charantia]|uniref:Hyoscyamine 6-dioxygenase-like n=1 Tax=Momordica charantia TaxID=3673 RepID=A0A6J1CP90_MOMCH|nr:hyoscyamine 6-dioxygenase-like [Momordica charantia]